MHAVHRCCWVYVGGVVAHGSLSPSVTIYSLHQSLLLSTLVCRCSFTVSFNTFYASPYYVSLLNTLIRIVHRILSYHNIVAFSHNDPATLYAPSLCISPRLLRCRAPPLAIPLPASSPWVPAWLTGLGVKPCIPYRCGLLLPMFRNLFVSVCVSVCLPATSVSTQKWLERPKFCLGRGRGWAKGNKRMWGPDPEAATLGHHHGRPQDFFYRGCKPRDHSFQFSCYVRITVQLW